MYCVIALSGSRPACAAAAHTKRAVITIAKRRACLKGSLLAINANTIPTDRVEPLFAVVVRYDSGSSPISAEVADNRSGTHKDFGNGTKSEGTAKGSAYSV
jgi:hypothetical protein